MKAQSKWTTHIDVENVIKKASSTKFAIRIMSTIFFMEKLDTLLAAFY